MTFSPQPQVLPSQCLILRKIHLTLYVLHPERGVIFGTPTQASNPVGSSAEISSVPSSLSIRTAALVLASTLVTVFSLSLSLRSPALLLYLPHHQGEFSKSTPGYVCHSCFKYQWTDALILEINFLKAGTSLFSLIINPWSLAHGLITVKQYLGEK